MRLKLFIIPAFYCLLFISTKAQFVSNLSVEDSMIYNPLQRKIEMYFFVNPDSILYYTDRILALASQSKNYSLMRFAYNIAGEAYRGKGNFPRSLEMQFNALQLNRKNKDRHGEAYTYSFIGFIYLQLGNYRQALNYLLPAKPVLDSTRDWIQSSFTASNTAYCYTMLDIRDSANYFNTESNRLMDFIDDRETRKMALRTLINDRMGNEYERVGNLDQAAYHYRLTLKYAVQDGIKINISRGEKNLAHIFMLQNKDDSATIYATNALFNSRLDRQVLTTIDAASILSRIYKKANRPDSALYYQTIVMRLQDSAYGMDNFRKLQLLMLDEQERQQQQVVKQAAFRARMRIILIAVVAVALLGVALILYRNNKNKQAINKKLEEQKINLENTLTELKATQAQLIQSEKMASLGELTAGIAHEIQNPLNFVNNFSETNNELLAELKEEMDKGNVQEVRALADDVFENNTKINHHGRRADSIVKSMLEHSRTAKGEKQPTDINALVDEYLRLAYHGFRAKDKAFNATMHKHFDASIGKVNIVPQEIGRVLLNLFNNAFYAVQEKRKKPGEGYEPSVTVGTGKSNGMIEIKVQDNGTGIPLQAIDKIFQPFFTTKPTGEGTGLGLSLSYDIIKAHGGELKVNSKEGEGSDFTVSLKA